MYYYNLFFPRRIHGIGLVERARYHNITCFFFGFILLLFFPSALLCKGLLS